MMKALIIGNLGYIGPVLTKHLHAAGNEVFGYDIGYFTGTETNPGGLLPETLLSAQFYGDVRKFNSDLLNGMDAVIYLAAISNDPMGNAFEQPTMEINCDAAVTIARLAKERGVKSFVFASSCSVYGLADSAPRNEQSEVAPLTAYAKSKVQAENNLRGLESKDFRITCLRFATACGFSSRLRLDLVLNDFVASALTTGRIEILSNGKPWRPLIDVKDMSRAIEWASQRTGEAFLVVNAGSNEWNYQVIELAEAVKATMPGVSISVNESAPTDNRSYRVDFSLFKALAPAHYPRCTLNSTISELHDGLRRLNFKDPNFRQSTFIRLRILNSLLEGGIINRQLQIV